MNAPTRTRPMLTFVLLDQHGPLAVRQTPAPVAPTYVVTDRPEWWILLRAYRLGDDRPLGTWLLAVLLLAAPFALLLSHL